MIGERICLDGKWRFQPEGASASSEVFVPSMWTHGQCFGYDPAWSSISRAGLSRPIGLPEFKEGRELVLRFMAVMLKAEVFVDGVRVGGHAGGFTPFELALPDELWKAKSGREVELSVIVDSARSAIGENGVERQISYPEAGEEGPLPGGVWQSVFLYERGKVHIEGLSLRYDLAAHGARFEVELRNGSSAGFSGFVELQIAAKAGAKALHEGRKALALSAGASTKLVFEFALGSRVEKWSHETPRLYDASASLFDADGALADSLIERTGFRSVGIAGGDLLLNGSPVHMFGLSLIRQRVAPYLWHRDYLELYFKKLKALGFNALRLHAAIAPPVALELADELGILLINQSSIWSGVHAAYRKAGHVFIENTKREFLEWHKRDRLHPSVLVWDVENEQIAIDRKNIPWCDELLDFMRELTGMPVEASGSGSASASDIHHLHCRDNLSALASDKYGKPFIAGEWWGPEKEYANKTHCAARALDEFLSEDDIHRQMGSYVAGEMLRARLGGAAGTFPFAIELFCFKPLFRPGDKLSVAVDDSGGRPALFLPEFFAGHNYHTPRRLLVNPGWNRERPRCEISRPFAKDIKKALAKILLAPADEARDLYEGSAALRFLVVNDSRDALKLDLRVKLEGASRHTKASIASKSLEVQVGGKASFEVALSGLRPGRPRLRVEAFAKGREVAACSSRPRVWPKPKAWRGKRRVALFKVDPKIEGFLSELGVDCRLADDASSLDDASILLVGSDSKGLAGRSLSDFVKKGGRLIVLRQESKPDFIEHPFKFKSAEGAVPYVMEGLAKDGRQTDFTRRGRVRDLSHPLFAGFDKIEFGPFPATASGRVADDAYLRPSLSDASRPGSCRILMEGAMRNQVLVAEIDYGEGLVLFNQLLLAENLGLSPLADMALLNMLSYADAYEAKKDAPLLVDDPALAAELAKLGFVEARPFSADALSGVAPGLAVLSSKANLLKLLAACDGEASPLRRWLSRGGRAVSLVKEDFAANGVETTRLEAGDVLTGSRASRSLERFGWNSLDVENSFAEAFPKFAFASAGSFKSTLKLFAHDDHDVDYGGVSLGRELGSLILEKRIGKGGAALVSLPLSSCDAPKTADLWSRLLSSAELPASLPSSFEDVVVKAFKTPPLPLDGDLRKWTCEELDRNIAPWSRAQSVIVSEDFSVKLCDFIEARGAHGAFFHLLHDDENLYLSALLIAPEFDFEDVETLQWDKDSIQLFLGSSQLVLSKRRDGGLFVGSRFFDQGVLDKVRGGVHEYPALPHIEGLKELKLRQDLPLKCVFIEVMIPLEIFKLSKEELLSGATPLGLAWNISTPGKPKRQAQFAFPKGFQWDDPSTFAKLRLLEGDGKP